MTVRLLRFILFFNEFVIEASKKFTDQRKRHASVPLYSYCFTLHSFCSKHTRDVMALSDRFLTFNFSHDNTKTESRKWVKLKMWSIGNHCISLAVFRSLIDVRYGNRSGSDSRELSSFNRCCCFRIVENRARKSMIGMLWKRSSSTRSTHVMIEFRAVLWKTAEFSSKMSLV